MYVEKKDQRICQGDIFENVALKLTNLTGEEVGEDSIVFPYVVVLTQDCDLSEDYLNREGLRREANITQDKYLPSILVCPLFIAEELKEGSHLRIMGLQMASRSGDLWKTIIRNGDKRFHYFDKDIKNEMPALIADFKYYYTIPRDDLYRNADKNYKVSISSLFRESLSQRFAYFLSRIGLPVIGECTVTAEKTPVA